jgi:hypothetical protein
MIRQQTDLSFGQKFKAVKDIDSKLKELKDMIKAQVYEEVPGSRQRKRKSEKK